MARSCNGSLHPIRGVLTPEAPTQGPGSSLPPHGTSKMGLPQIVRLRQMVIQWRRRAVSNLDRTLHSMSPRARKLLRSSSSCGQSSSSPSSASPPSSSLSSSASSHSCIVSDGGTKIMSHGGLAPQGYLAIYVGRERRRFEIRAEHINHPVLRGLLQRTEEEFGLNQTGGLAIPACQVVLFEHLLWMLDNHDTAHLLQDPSELSELLDLYVPKRATLAGIACSTREKNLPTPTSAAHSG